MPGTLYLVATPIGNLEDLTHRAVRVLSEVDRIACEDTRHSRRLLDRYGIAKPLISYHEHNETARVTDLIERLLAGENIAIISDAGTPLISDPGYRIVAEAAARGVPVVPVPGPSAILAALTASGLPTDSFFFGGFLPARDGARRRALEAVRELEATLVFYEAPHRALDSLAVIGEVLGARPCVLCRELTKLHEEFLRGTPAEIAAELARRDSVRGEITLVIGKPVGAIASERSAVEAVEQLVGSGVAPMDAIKTVARQRGLHKRELYAEYDKARR